MLPLPGQLHLSIETKTHSRGKAGRTRCDGFSFLRRYAENEQFFVPDVIPVSYMSGRPADLNVRQTIVCKHAPPQPVNRAVL